MKKLIRGIVEFRKNTLHKYKEKFSHLELSQRPDTLFITCSDSRVAPNWFASTNPGDLFVVRNVGNLIPSCGEDGHSTADESEAAAIEFAIMNLNISDIIVCGHSDCGAMHALLNDRNNVKSPNLREWLRHGEDSLQKLTPNTNNLSQVNALSQLNVLRQLEHLKTYPLVKEHMAQNNLKLHGWWFDLGTVGVYAFVEAQNRFVLIDENFKT